MAIFLPQSPRNGGYKVSHHIQWGTKCIHEEVMPTVYARAIDLYSSFAPPFLENFYSSYHMPLSSAFPPGNSFSYTQRKESKAPSSVIQQHSTRW